MQIILGILLISSGSLGIGMAQVDTMMVTRHRGDGSGKVEQVLFYSVARGQTTYYIPLSARTEREHIPVHSDTVGTPAGQTEQYHDWLRPVILDTARADSSLYVMETQEDIPIWLVIVIAFCASAGAVSIAHILKEIYRITFQKR